MTQRLFGTADILVKSRANLLHAVQFQREAARSKLIRNGNPVMFATPAIMSRQFTQRTGFGMRFPPQLVRQYAL